LGPTLQTQRSQIVGKETAGEGRAAIRYLEGARHSSGHRQSSYDVSAG